MEGKVLDCVLVPLGMGMMVAYHLWLLYRILKHPSKTVIGINTINRRFWVRAMMEDLSKNGLLSVQTLRNHIMASTLLASTAITLSSILAVLMTSNSWDHSARTFVVGDRSELGFSIKFFSVIVCFLLASLFTVQSIRYYSHASMLINVPVKTISSTHHHHHHHHHHLSPEYVARCVNMGGYFWSLGLRAFYFSFPLLMWIFGPIPMFLACLVLVVMLYSLDVSLEFGKGIGVGVGDGDHNEDMDMGTPQEVTSWCLSYVGEVRR